MFCKVFRSYLQSVCVSNVITVICMYGGRSLGWWVQVVELVIALLSYLVHVHSHLRPSRQGLVHVSPITWEGCHIWHLGAPDSPVLHRIVTVRCAFWRCSDSARTVHVAGDRWSRPLRSIAVAPLAHRTVRWIIAELLSRNPKVKSSTCTVPGAPDTVRWHTGQSGAPDQGSLRFLLVLSFEP
jgi:hypothetical protein